MSLSCKQLFVKHLNSLLFVLACLNVFVVWRFETFRPTVTDVRREFIVTNSVVVVTNMLSSVQSTNTNTTRVQRLLDKSIQVSFSYDFFTWGGRIYVKLFNDNLTFGSPTSFGRIVEIYPDRILTDSGIYIVNSTPPANDRLKVESSTFKLDRENFSRVNDLKLAKGIEEK